MTNLSELRPMDSAELFRRHGRFVARLLYRLGVPAAMIEDAVQDVFVVVHQRGGYVPGPAKPTSYLAVIACNAAYKLRRAERVRAQRHVHHVSEELPSVQSAPDQGLHAAASLARVRAALDRMDSTLATTLLLADGEDEPCASIAAAMKVPIGTVYWRLHRARAKFVDALKRVDADLAREAREAAPSIVAPLAERAPRSTLGLPRKAVIAMLFGFSTFLFRESEAHALLKKTRQLDGMLLDESQLLARHLEHVAQSAPAPPWALPSASPQGIQSVGMLKGGLLVGAGITAGVVLVTTRAPRAEPPRVAEVVSMHARDSDYVAAEVDGQSSGLGLERAALHDIRARAAVPASKPGQLHMPSAETEPLVRSTTPAIPSVVQLEGLRTKPAPRPSVARTSSPPDAINPVSREAAPVATNANPSNELAQFARAASLAEKAPQEALALLEQLGRGGVSAYLEEERLYIIIVAQKAAGRIAQARASARAFLDRYPKSGFAPRVRALKLVYSPD